jgi:hypothetical protein
VRVLRLRDGLERELTRSLELATELLDGLHEAGGLTLGVLERLEALLEELHRGGDALTRHADSLQRGLWKTQV